MAAVADLLRGQGLLVAEPAVNPLAPKPPQFPAKAKSVIFMLMDGGPSQVDLFEPKPELNKHQGEPLPPSVAKNLHLAFTKPNAAIYGSPRTFKQYGQSGIQFCDLLPNTAACAGSTFSSRAA